ncbi:MAG: ribonuclease H-like domain-containing protein [Candidatus Pacebacteria bacterium]|nr:ribonuclease H-like domain-containing protein [Candidatus Paceibacterota bacterium]
MLNNNNDLHYIIFDIETQNTFDQVGSRDAAALSISLLVTWDSKTKEYKSYLENELEQLWPVLEQVDMLVGYNSDHFDIPLLNKYYPGDLTAIKSLDLLKEIHNVLGRRLRLDDVAAATLGTKKSGHGLDAIRWWEAGEIEKIRKYCQKDVEITKRIFDYILKHGSVKYKDFNKKKDLGINTSQWLKPTSFALTHTLGF